MSNGTELPLSKPGAPANMLRFFDAVYLLNLPERIDRLRDTLAQLTRIDSEAVRLVRVFAGTRATEAHGFPSPGAYGCFQGHLGILRDACAAGTQRVLVLEDDVRFLPNLAQDWPRVAQALDECPWGIVNLGFDDFDVENTATTSPLVRVTQPLMLAHCYAVHGTALPRLIAFLEELQTRAYGDPKGGPMHYDGALFHFSEAHPDPPRLRTTRSLAGQRSSRSDIAEGRWFDRNPRIRPVAAWLRALRNRM